MQLVMILCSVLVAALCLVAVADGRPATEEGSRQRRSSGRCQPKSDSPYLEQRALCPFTTKLSKVFADKDLEVEKAELDPECARGLRSCGEGGSGQCTPVNTIITYGDQNATVILAFVCTFEEGGVPAHQTPNLFNP